MPKKREEGTLGTHLVRGLGDLPGRLARRGGFSGAGGAVVVAGGGGGGGGEGRFGRGVVGLEAEEVGVGGGGRRGVAGGEVGGRQPMGKRSGKEREGSPRGDI